MHLIQGGLTPEIEDRHNIRQNEIARILHNMEAVFSPEELEEAAPIISWLMLRDTWHYEPWAYKTNPGEPVEAYEERIRIAQEMEEMFPQHRVGTCANIWLWLRLGANR